MKASTLLAVLVIAILAPVASGEAAYAAAASRHEIRVTLFGQPCILSGPLSEDQLTAIHRISPEQIPPELNLANAKQAIERLRRTSELPSALDGYRTHLITRVEAQLAFLGALADFKKNGKTEPLAEIARKYVSKARFRAYESAQKIAAASPKSATALDRLTEAYDESIEPHPEEEFHRAIERMGVSYACSFDSGDDSGDSGDVSDGE
jgi:hypothetical protein